MAELGAGAGTGYPAAVDTKQTYVNGPNPVADSNSRVDSEFMNDAYAAIIAIQAELGVNPAGADWATLVARLNDFLAGNDANPQLIVSGVGPRNFISPLLPIYPHIYLKNFISLNYHYLTEIRAE